MADVRACVVLLIVLAANGCSTARLQPEYRPNSASKKPIPSRESAAIRHAETDPRPEPDLAVQLTAQRIEQRDGTNNSDPDDQAQTVPPSADGRDVPIPPAPDGGGEQAFPDDQPQAIGPSADGPELPISPAPDGRHGEPAIVLGDVVASVYDSYPLLVAAFLEGAIADGNQLATWGAFDTKLKGATENGPTGFYQTYRNSAGLNQPIYHGGEVFGGYRIGRGFFEPWYLERQTNDAGEFKAGVRVPLLRNRNIDARRADLWRATFDQQRVRPEIRAELIEFVREASIAYWIWIAAGKQYDIGREALRLSVERNARLQRRVEEGDLDPPVQRDNDRSIAQRESKLIDRRRKLQQSAVKLSLFLRSPDGVPIVPAENQLGEFPSPVNIPAAQIDSDIQAALSQRPELAALDALRRRVNVDLAEACNDCLPNVDAQLVGSQDLGEPTSSKRDKSEFELEAAVFVDVPLQRRKARGKSRAAQAKLSQLAAKRRFTQDKIIAEVQAAYAGLRAAYERVAKARESKRLAEYMAGIERTKFDLGETDLLSVFLREQAAIEAADEGVIALLEYFIAEADYVAALADDRRAAP